jgi:hypothetical protein
MSTEHSTNHVAAVSVGALAAAGHFLKDLEPILASLSYLAAIAVAVVTIFFKIRDRNK